MFLSLMVAAVEDLPMKSRFLTVEDKTYMLQNPEFVAEGAVDAKWSPDGTQLLVVCEDPKRGPLDTESTARQIKFLFWSVTMNKALGAFAIPTTSKIGGLEWEGPNGSVILGLHTNESPDMSINRVLVNGSARTLAPLAGGMSTSPKQKGVMVLMTESGGQSIYYFPGGQADGVKLSPPLGSIFRGMRGGDDFTVVVGAGKSVTVMNYDPGTGSYRPVKDLKPQGQIFAVKGDGMSRYTPNRTQYNVDSLWLAGDPEAKYPTALLSTLGTRGEFCSANRAAWYIESGNLFVRKSKAVTKEEIDSILECEEMHRLMSETKQVGTALQIYAADNDDVFPEPDKMRNAILPYTKSEQLLAGFVPTYKGALKLYEVADPEKLEIGYKLGDYGRAVAYSDTHVVWESNRQRPRIGCEV